jgi:Sec-independent protein secretion pathway component TatC
MIEPNWLSSCYVEGAEMSHGVEYTWRNLAEASAEATRKFAWIAAGLFLASSVLAYFSITTHLRYSQTCDYIATHAPVIAVQQTEEALFARSLLQKHCR